MKKLLLSIVCGICTIFAFAGCVKNNSSDSTKEENKIVISIENIANCKFGDTVVIPEILIVNGLGEVLDKTYSIKVLDANGAEVSITNESFVVNVVGEYSVIITCEGESKTIKFTCSALKKAPVADLQISLEGVISFTEAAGETYALLCNGTEVCTVKSGDNINSHINDGNNNFAVVTKATQGYEQSEPSNIVNIEKLEKVKELSVSSDYVLSFTELPGVVYEFYLNGSTEALYWNTGDNILKYLVQGDNTVYVVAKKTGAIDSQPSDNFIIKMMNHYPVSEISVDESGVITFAEAEGCTYTLYINGEKRGAIESGGSICSHLNASEQLTTVSVQVQVAADDTYQASTLSDAVNYYYGHGMFGEIVYSGWSMAEDQNGLKPNYGKITEIENVHEEAISYMRFSAVPQSDNIKFAAVKFEEPLNVVHKEDSVQYFRIWARFSADFGDYYAFNYGKIGTYNGAYAQLYSHNYNGNWAVVEIQIPETQTSIDGFWLEIVQSNGWRKTFVDIQKYEVVSYPKNYQSKLGDVQTASDKLFGYATTDYWSVPFVMEDVNEKVSCNGQDYNGYLSLTRPEKVSFGGNKAWASEGTSIAGAVILKDFSAYSTAKKVEITMIIKAEYSLAIEGYYGSALKKTNIIEPTGKWEEVKIYASVEDLQGIAFTTVNTKANYSETTGIYIADISIQEAQLPPVAEEFSISKTGVVTFVGKEEYTYSLYDNEELIMEDIKSGDEIDVTVGNHNYYLQTFAVSGLTNETESLSIVYALFGYENADAGWLGTTSKTATYSQEVVDGITAVRADIPAGTGRRAFSIELEEPIATQAGKVNYAVITIKTPKVAPEGVTVAWLAVNNSKANYLRFSYNMVASSWMTLYIQLPENETAFASFNYAAEVTNGNRATYLYISDVRVESFDTEITTGKGTFVVAEQDGFGKMYETWATPLTVTENAEATVIYNGETYTGIVTLTNGGATFGGTTTADNAAYQSGAMLNFASTSIYSTAKVKLLVKINEGAQVAIAGYNGTVDKTSNIVTGTGEWQEIELTLTTSDLSGITFVVLENALGDRPAGEGAIAYATETTIQVASVTEIELVKMEAVSDFAVSEEYIATFTEENGKVYALYNGEVELCEIHSGADISSYLQSGNNAFSVVVKASGDYLDSDKSNVVEFFKMMFGEENPDLGWLSATSKVASSYSVETVDGVQALRADMPAGTGRRGFTLELFEPIATQAGKVNYAVITIKTPKVTPEGVTVAWLTVNNSKTNYLRFSYNMIADSWMTLYIQLDASVTELSSFNYAAEVTNGNRATYLYVSDVRVESFDTAITTGVGTFVVSQQAGFGNLPATWSTPYIVTEDTSATVTYNEQTYTGVVTLTDNVTTFGGTNAANSSAAYHTGAMLNYTTESTAETVTVKVLVKISAGSKVAIAGYNGTVDKTSNIIEGTGEWQEIELTLTTADLSGITFVAIENATANRVGGTVSYVTASTIQIANVEEA